jgi:hypothetical protein
MRSEEEELSQRPDGLSMPRRQKAAGGCAVVPIW